MSELAIRVENIGKKYTIGIAPERYRTLRDSLTEAASAPVRWARSGADRLFHRGGGTVVPGDNGGQAVSLSPRAESGGESDDILWALRDVSFEVHKGEVLGVIGRNGAGKSTLLKILSRVTEPTVGLAEIHGRVGSLLEVGTGFHPELTGRENIYLNGAILGMKRSEIEKKFDEIVAFSEVDRFIDTPVKRYSSGMYLRLAFAVAAHLEPEILVVDEVLAVGDAEFQRKCLGKMSDVAQQGRTILFVSHNMSAILRLTQETIVLDKGQLVLRTDTPRAVDYYMSSGYAQIGERVWTREEVATEAAPFCPIAVRVRNSQQRVVDTLRSVEPMILEVEYVLDAPVTGLRVGIYLMTTRGEYVLTSFDTDEPEQFDRLRIRQPGHYFSRCQIPPDFLNEGRYVIGVNASTYRIKRYFQDEQALTFTVDAAGAPGMQWVEPRLGPIRPRFSWQVLTMGSEHGFVEGDAKEAKG
jgi:lipopolysaccharide transport system ATP-binding protein